MLKFKKIPIAGTPIRLADLWKGFEYLLNKGEYIEKYERTLSNILNLKYCFVTGSGKTAFYMILEAIKKLSDGNGKQVEVILPDYTDMGLVLAVQRAGLRTVFCDVSAEDFNLDVNLITRYISGNTLCVVPVHMFGLACDMLRLNTEIETAERRIGQKIWVIEDCAQAMGTEISSRQVGTFGDVSFYSFGRGKNFTTYSGGCIATNSSELAEMIRGEIGLLPLLTAFPGVILFLKLLILSFAVNPIFYGVFYPLLSAFKSGRVHSSFPIFRYDNIQAVIGLSLLDKIEEFNRKRYVNGSTLIRWLASLPVIVLPKILRESKPVYNRLPVLFSDAHLREEICLRLSKAGIECSKMYPYALHQLFGSGDSQHNSVYPIATSIAEKVLVLPTHPFINDNEIGIITQIFKKVLL